MKGGAKNVGTSNNRVVGSSKMGYNNKHDINLAYGAGPSGL